MKLFRTYPLLSRFICFILLPVLFILTYLFLHFRASVGDSYVTLTSKKYGAATISRDSHGVAVIEASSDSAAFYAVGYAQAQDRMWQLEIQRRIASGNLSALLGKEALSQDVLMRTLGIERSAVDAMQTLDAPSRLSLTAYADGINKWLSEKHPLPIEFSLLHIAPRPWREVDSIAWSKVFALNLAENMWAEIANQAAAEALSPAQFHSLTGIVSEENAQGRTAPGPSFRAASEGLFAIEEALKANGIGGRFVGSNAWVVSAKLMKSGRATLANDPHLTLGIPSLWYPMSIKGDRINAAGMGLIGLPIVVFGHNEKIAWGGTSLLADVQDLYVEQINPANPREYMFEGKWRPFDVRQEKIEVRPEFPQYFRAAEPPVVLTVRSTAHGPLVSDVVAGAKSTFSLQWTALGKVDQSYGSMFHADYAEDYRQFQEAFRNYVAPAMNILFVDDQNNIGSFAIGRIPIRSRGLGQLPVEGWTGAYSWTGYIPFDAMPRQFNPDKGFIVSANGNPADKSYPYLISNAWAESARTNRITNLLLLYSNGGRKITVPQLIAIQTDQKDLSVSRLLSEMVRVSRDMKLDSRYLKALADWDGQASLDSVGASVFYSWARHLKLDLFGPRVNRYSMQGDDKALGQLAENTTFDQVAEALSDRGSDWCSEGDATSHSCSVMLSRSLKEAVDELTLLAGPDPSKWQWGKIHERVLAHTPFDADPLLSSIFSRKAPSGGAVNTVNVADAQFLGAKGYRQTFGAGFRQIMEAPGSELSIHLYMNSSGQSGNLFSSHYDDMVKPFNDGELFEFPKLHITNSPSKKLVN